MTFNSRPPWPLAGTVLECIGGPKDGDHMEIFSGREVHFYIPSPLSVLDLAGGDYEPVAPAFRVGIYEISLYGRGHGKGKPVDWFHALKWAGER